MTKQINVRFLMILVSVSFVSLVGFYFLYQFQKNRTANGLLTRAEQKKQEGKFAEAASFYMRYLARRPNEKEKYSELALTMKQMIDQKLEEGYSAVDAKSFQSTYAMIEEALRKNADDLEVREAAVEFATRFNRLTDAITHLRYLLEHGNQDKMPEWTVQLARCYTQSGQDNLAVASLRELVGFDDATRTFNEEKALTPHNEQAYLLLASIYRQKMRDPQSANLVVNQMVKMNPESYNAYLNRARYYRVLGPAGKDDANRDIAKALELAPEEFEVLNSAAMMKLENKEFDEAKRLFEVCVEKFPDKIAGLIGLSQWAVQQNDLEQAIDYVNEGLKIDPDNDMLLWSLGNLELERKNFDTVQQLMAQMKELNFPRFYIDFLDARVLLAKEQWLQSSQKLEEVRPQIEQYRPEWAEGLNKQLAACYDRLGQQDLRLKACNRILDTDATDAAARWWKVQALLAMGQNSQAVQEYELLERQLDDEDRNPAWLLTQLQMEVLQQEQLPESRRNWSQARELVQRVSQEPRISPAQRAQVVAGYFYAVGDREKGDEIVARAKTLNPNNLRLVVNEIRELAGRESVAAAMERLDEYEQSAGKSVETRLLRISLLAQSDLSAAKEEVAQLEADAPRLDEDQQAAVYRRIGAIYAELNEFAAARKVWQKVAEMRPSNIDIRISLFELALQIGDEEAMRESLDGIEQLVGRNSAQWKWAEAARLTWQVRNERQPATALDNAQGLIEEAIALRDKWEPLYRVQAEIHLIRNRNAEAIEALERSLDVGKGNSVVFRQLVRLYYDAKRFEDAELMLQRLPKSQWSGQEQQIWLEILASRQELPEDLPFDVETADAKGLLWYGKLLTNAGRLEEGEAAIRKSVEQRPTDPEGWLALVRLLAVSGRPEDAEEAVRQAQLELVEEDSAVFLAGAYEILQDNEKAEQYFREALERNPDNVGLRQRLASLYINTQQADQAITQLETMMEDGEGSTNSPGTIAWARLAMAGVKATTGSYRDYLDAVKLIESNASENGLLRPQEATLLAQITLQRPDGASRQRVITKFEEIQESRELTYQEKLLLAQLYYRQNMWSDCRSLMNELLIKRADDIRLLEPWLQWLLEQDELQQASKWVENCPPGSLTAIRTKAHLDVRRGRSRQALEWLKPAIPANLPPEKAPQVKAVAQILEQLSAYDPNILPLADKVWRRYVEMNPRDALSYASYLGRRGGEENVRQAMEICGQAVKAGNVQGALKVSVALLRANRRSLANRSAYDREVSNWFDQAQEEMPENLMLLIQRSEFEEITGRFEEHERWLRELMTSPRANQIQRAMVANNLAYLLALKETGEEPMKLIQFAMQILGPTADLRDTLGMVYLREKKFDEAIDEFVAAIGDGGANGFKYAHLARAHWEAGHEKDAADAVQRALARRDDLKLMNDLEYENFLQIIETMQERGLLKDQEEAVNAVLQTQAKKAA